ncbi:MAG TPA: formate dehydrogenase accessory protein FdhE [Desulfuromonadaceae bacterium]
MNPETAFSGHTSMDAPITAIRFLRLPGRDIFSRRAGRLRHLSGNNQLLGTSYLAFLAQLCESQQHALDRFPAVRLPDHLEQRLCREHGMPLLAAGSHHRDPAWRQALIGILQRMKGHHLPQATREAMAGLAAAEEALLEEMADRILAGDLETVPPGSLPFVAAALQVYWVHMAAAMEEEAFSRLAEKGLCPVCGSHPSVGVVHASGPEQGLRYLSCSLCAVQWHLVRITCSRCDSTAGIDYYAIEGTDGAVKAESCADCGTYLKLLYLEKDGRMEATADDLATLSLDMLMDDEGKLRRGPNLLFHPGGAC